MEGAASSKTVKGVEGVSESDKKKILGGNAMRLFGLEAV
jgi:predicted TIM-barrel fold metal-dependent hydrolase